jgi:hypothetical protein
VDDEKVTKRDVNCRAGRQGKNCHSIKSNNKFNKLTTTPEYGSILTIFYLTLLAGVVRLNYRSDPKRISSTPV